MPTPRDDSNMQESGRWETLGDSGRKCRNPISGVGKPFAAQFQHGDKLFVDGLEGIEQATQILAAVLIDDADSVFSDVDDRRSDVDLTPSGVLVIVDRDGVRFSIFHAINNGLQIEF